jgi:hypothetical protein
MTHRAVRCQDSYIVHTVGSLMAVRLSALCTSFPLPPEKFLVFVSVRGCAEPQGSSAAGRNLGQLKIPLISSGIKPMTIWLAAYYLNQQCYHLFPYLESSGFESGLTDWLSWLMFLLGLFFFQFFITTMYFYIIWNPVFSGHPLFDI